MSTSDPWLFIPLETKVRELHAKLLLASVATEYGFQVLLGDGRVLRQRMGELPQGIFVDKGIPPNRAARFARFRRIGHQVVAWCEEGLTLVDTDEYLRSKVNPRALEQARCFFAWGPYQARLITDRYPALAEKVVAVGNPRIDLLRPEMTVLFAEESNLLRERYGAFILINSNFAICNHFKGEGAFLEAMKRSGKVSTLPEEQLVQGWIDYRHRVFSAFLDAIGPLASAFPNKSIVIRPHPSEDHSSWESMAANHANVQVRHAGSVLPWILAADATVHNGCTTGFEAYLLGKSPIAYMPIQSAQFDSHLPNSVSDQVQTVAGLIDLVGQESRIESPAIAAERRRIVAEHVNNSGSELASDRIAKMLLDISRKSPVCSEVPPGVDKATSVSRTLSRSHHGRQPTVREQEHGYGDHKFPGLHVEEVQSVLEDLRRATGRFAQVRLREAGRSCVQLTGAV